jgi:glycogen debranching enzyme
MKKFLLLILIIASVAGKGQNIRVGFVGERKLRQASASTKAAWLYLKNNKNVVAKYLTPEKLKHAKHLKKYDVLWFYYPDSCCNTDIFSTKMLKNIDSYVTAGGHLLLTQAAVRLINTLGIEPNPVEQASKEATDSGYGRMLGFHAFLSHPIFEGLNGGAYVLKPSADIDVTQYGFFGDNLPGTGKVVAVDWDYIFLRENKKIILEYEPGKGKILAVGGYINLEYPAKENALNGETYNVNRLHLEKFIANCLDYLAGKSGKTPARYWNYQTLEVNPFDSEKINLYPLMRPLVKSHPWEMSGEQQNLSRRYATDDFWDVAGQRILLTGKESGGIEEIWTHPFMAFRDYEAGIRFSYADTILWLNDQEPSVTVTPEALTRLYRFKRAFLKEVITASPDNAGAVIHYEYRGVYPAEIYIRFKSNERLMWPYSSNVFGGLKYDFNEQLNAFVVTDPTENFVSLLGTNKPARFVHFNSSPMLPAFRRVLNPIGNYSAIDATDSLWRATPAPGQLLVAGLTAIPLEMNDNFDVVIAAGSQGMENAVALFQQIVADPSKLFQASRQYKRKFENNMLRITTPDTLFNRGYQWALEGADRFYVNTPGIGKSLVAGYGTTATGWDGGHKVNGRPGYAWYFGRDSEWSGMALLHYGDFEKVKNILTLLQDYQDLNGKILHELSTSGIVHYDAADATPLYVVLAGRYLMHSGDTAFIKASWPHISAALNYMYSTDTDGDGLIENTNVGHGWVEGGGLFGSHTSLYLASCQAEALKMAAYMAIHTGKTEAMQKYEADHQKVTGMINNLFWNKEEQCFYHGLKQDGSFIDEESIMSVIPVLFDQAGEHSTDTLLEAFAGNEYTADWGVRIVSEQSKLFHPHGYHTGSVWPLYTGWTALAEYRSGRPVQGFSHTMNNMLVYQNWALGFIEEVLNGIEYKPSGVCHHQCWSETMALQPAIEGMLGLMPDAPANRLTFSPRFPADWDTVTVDNISMGKHRIGFRYERDSTTITYTFVNNGDLPLSIRFAPTLPKGCVIKNKFLDGKMLRPADHRDTLTFTLSDKHVITYRYEYGTEVLPVINHPKPGYPPEGLRIISDRLTGNVYEIKLQAPSGTREEFQVYIHGQHPVKVEKAERYAQEGEIYRFKVDFPNTTRKYAFQTVRIYLD